MLATLCEVTWERPLCRECVRAVLAGGPQPESLPDRAAECGDPTVATAQASLKTGAGSQQRRRETADRRPGPRTPALPWAGPWVPENAASPSSLVLGSSVELCCHFRPRPETLKGESGPQHRVPGKGPGSTLLTRVAPPGRVGLPSWRRPRHPGPYIVQAWAAAFHPPTRPRNAPLPQVAPDTETATLRYGAQGSP